MRSEFIHKFTSKTIALTFFTLIIGSLFVTSRWVDKDLYIRTVVEDSKTTTNTETVAEKEVQGKADVEDMEVFKEVTTDSMLKYLQDKYDEEFDYLNYTDGGILAREGMTVYPKNGNDYFDKFNIQKQPDGTYTDTYMNIYTRNMCTSQIKEIINPLFKEKTGSFIHVEIGDMNLSEYTKETLDTIKVFDVNITVLVDCKEYTQEELDVLLKTLTSTLEENNYTGSIQVVSLKLNDFATLTEYSLDEYNNKDYIKFQSIATLKVDIDKVDDDNGVVE